MVAATKPSPIADTLKGIVDRLNNMDARFDAMAKPQTGARPVGGLDPQRSVYTPDGTAPAARRGESALSSRGFMFSKLLHAKAVGDDNIAKNELALCKSFSQKAYGQHFKPLYSNMAQGFLVPVFPDLLPTDLLDNNEYHEAKSYIAAGINGADPEEVKWWMTKANVVAPSNVQSWVDQSVGGAFVPPPMFGAPIELLRNKAAMLNAGATIMPLGPSGRITFPRLTNATTGGWTGENTQMTPSQAGTGLLELSAKKAWGVVVLPGELIRFGSPATEVMIRNDLFQTVSLIMDKGFLDGAGSSNVPLGIATMGASTTAPPYVAASSTAYGVSGYGIALPYIASNEVTPQNVYDFIAAIKANNAVPTVWIMRPEMAAGFFKARSTPYSSGTNAGQFVFDITRSQSDPQKMVLAGLPIVETVQVSNTRGNGSQTYIICMNGPDFYVGMFGAIEFTQTDQGWTLLSNDQVAVRALISCDAGSRHPGSISFADQVSYAVGP
jgi:HK97 family phage major capsid protein